MKPSRFLFLVLWSISTSFTAFSQTPNSLDKEEYLLNGISFTFQYQNAGAIDISFADNKLTYKWISGRNASEPAKTYPYKSRKIDSEVYLVNWHEPDTENFVTQVYNFKSNTVAVSVISRYSSETPFLGFQAGIIEHFNEKKQ